MGDLSTNTFLPEFTGGGFLSEEDKRVAREAAKAEAIRIAELKASGQVDVTKAISDPKGTQADIIRKQQEYAERTFIPIENQLVAKVTGSTEGEADRAGAITRKAFMKSRESSSRDISRRGFSLTTAQSDALNRRRAITETKGIATAENITRRTLEDRNRNLLGNLAGMGRGIATSSMDAFSGASDAQASREATGEQLKAQSKASKTSGAASGAAMGASYGAVGALVGGAIGWLSG